VQTISIITPVFNGEKFLEQTIISVLEASKNVNHEYIIVNDGSTDGTKKIIEKYANSIKIINQVNRGQSNAINNALKNASGNLALVVNCDDPLMGSELLEKSLQIFANNEDIVVTYPDWNLIDIHGNVIKTVLLNDFNDNEFIGESKCVIGPGAIFKISSALNIGGWNTKFKYVPDYDFWLKMRSQGEFYHLNEVMAQWRKHPGSLSINGRGIEMALERIKVINLFVQNTSLSSELKKSAISYSLVSAAKLSYFYKEIPARSYWLRAIYHFPKIIVKIPIHYHIYFLLNPISFYVKNLVVLFFIKSKSNFLNIRIFKIFNS
jgi:glycosyltransferase involved in cell wall biosynthesis